MKPNEIEAESFRIIESIVDYKAIPASEWQVTRRMIHACGDPAIIDTVRISANFMANVKAGTPIVCDVNMLKSGLSAKVKANFDVHCFIDNQEVAATARELGVTRAKTAMRYAAARYPEAVYLIGNAPTALLELIELYNSGKIAPALVVGIPVGFVMAAESKDLLINTTLKYVTNLGYKGGSPMTAAAMNAIALIE
ncbi:MAG: precorrin-8X methylmutase [Deferribacteraceae bacterium]|jgi:precorrin-8X/cobalt-precorrin-8 methylmutase|nr:precorrin-8X methylmutase [Deferribacteraceae bacterium]